MSAESRARCEFDPRDLALRLDVSLAADVSRVGVFVERIMTVVRSMGCAAGSEFEVELALTEALANAVKHGCKGDPAKTVRVTVECDQERGMLVIVRDPGDGFVPAELPDPLIGEQLFESHGRGIYLINRLMDEVRIERGGTEIWMRKK
jgi:serine/threonine-protein kinase RsbW